MSETQVAKAKETNVVNIFSSMEEHAAEGLDAIGTEDMQIPFLRLVQQLSPQLNKKEANYIEGISSGDIFNTVTNQFWDGEQGVVVIPCGYVMKYLEFGLRDEGGGFMGEIPANHADLGNTTREGTVEKLPSGNELVRSAQHLVLIVDLESGRTQQAIVDMKKTQLKVSRRWNTQMRMVQYEGAKGPYNPPMWGTAWRLTTVSESSNNNTWTNWAVENVPADQVPMAAFETAREFFNSFRSGDVKTGTGEHAGDDPQNAAPQAQTTPSINDDVPF